MKIITQGITKNIEKYKQNLNYQKIKIIKHFKFIFILKKHKHNLWMNFKL